MLESQASRQKSAEGRVPASIAPRAHDSVVFALVDRSPEPVVIHDWLRVRHANPAAQRLFGLSEATAGAARPVDSLWSGDAGDASHSLVIRAASGAEWTVQATHVRVYVGAEATTATFLSDPESLRVPLERLAALERSQIASVLASGLAHELAGPAVPLLAAVHELDRHVAQLLTEAPTDPRVRAMRDCVELAGTATQAIVSLLRDHRAFLRPSNPVDEAPACDPRLALEQAVRMIRPRIESVGELAVELDAVPALRVPAGHLTQVALNLLNNAADALHGRGRPGKIELNLWSSEDSVVFDVRDDGPGLSPEVMVRLFEPNVSTKPASSSLGLGLSICQALVERMGGHISAGSTPGVGTTFRVSLPLERRVQGSA